MIRKEYIEKLLSGKKATTIRIGKYVPLYREVIIHSGGRPCCLAEITFVKYKKISDLTDEDAIRDGFPGRTALLNELRKIYGYIKGKDLVTILGLKIIKLLDDVEENDPYLGLSPQIIAMIALRYLRKELNKEEIQVLEELGKGLSIRAVARKMTGNPTARSFIRKIVRRALRTLINKGLLKKGGK